MDKAKLKQTFIIFFSYVLFVAVLFGGGYAMMTYFPVMGSYVLVGTLIALVIFAICYVIYTSLD